MIDTYHGIWIKSYREYCYFRESPGAYFRKAFTVPEGMKEAKIQICGLGFHEIWLNGAKVGDRWFAPALSQYDCRCGSITYDVTDQMLKGEENVIIVMLGNGFFNCRNSWQYTVNFSSWRTSPRLICDILIDGKPAVVSGTDWKTHPSPVVFDCHHLGEDYDARLELPAAFRSGFDDSDWTDAFRAYPPGGILERDEDEPCRELFRCPGRNIAPEKAGYLLFDFGTTIAGVIEVKMRGRTGSKATFRYAEVLGGDGHVDTSGIDLGAPRFETDTYTFRGEGVETWHLAEDHNMGTSGGIVFRGAEAMLIYMEASYEKNGNIDATADRYWRALRTRAKVDPDYNKTIAATIMTEEAKGDFGAYSKGALIDPTLYNIRRERRNELCAEAFRWADIKRWRALDQLQTTPYRAEGMRYWGSVYEEELKDLCIVDPNIGNMSSSESSVYILPFEKVLINNTIYTQGGFLFTPAHYLDPIGMAAFRKTAVDAEDFTSSVIYQNPGWSYEAGTGASKVN